MKGFLRQSVLLVPILLVIACTVSVNNVWKVPNTDLAIAVEKKKSDAGKDEFERQMVLREKHLDKTTVKLAKSIDTYTKIEVFRIGADRYLLKDAFEEYILDTTAKTLTKTAPGVLTQTFESADFPQTVGSFADNESGNWRFIPAS